MSVGFLNYGKKWLLMGFVVLTPILSSANLEGASLEKKTTWSVDQEEDQLVERLEKLVIDFHDLVLLSFWNNNFEYPPTLLIDDALSIALVIKSIEPINGVEFAGLLANYYAAAGSYLGNLQSGNLCTVPNSASQLLSDWLNAASLLADFVSSKSLHTPKEVATINKLFLDWTQAQINYINNAAPQCANNSIPVNAAASAKAYTKARALTYFIALEVFKTFENM